MASKNQVMPAGADGPPSKKEAAEPAVSKAGLNVRPAGVFRLDPQSEFQKKWDLFIIVLLLFTAAVTPAEVAFLEPRFDLLFAVNRFVDLGFIIDMVFQFFLGFQDSETFEIVYDRGRINRNYLIGWFPIDLVSILPFDLIGLVMESDDVAQLKVLRVVRLLRLIKLLRVLRSARIFARIEHSLGWSHVSLGLIKFLLMIIVCIHWTACLVTIVPQIADRTVNWIKVGRLQDAGPAVMFLRAFEYGLNLLVCGYGTDAPSNMTERTWAIAVMLLTIFLYAYVQGSICDSVANMDPATSEAHERMDTLNLFLEELKMPKERRMAFRMFVSNCTQMQRHEYYNDVVSILSPALRGELCEQTSGPWLRQVPFFCCARTQGTTPPLRSLALSEAMEEQQLFIVTLAQRLHRVGFVQGERIFQHGDVSNRLYIVQQGIIGCNGRVLRSGSGVGYDMICSNGRRTTMATALTFVDLQALDRDDLFQVLEDGDFPKTEFMVNSAAFKMALRQYFRGIVTRLKTANGFKAGASRMTEEDIANWKSDMEKAVQRTKDAEVKAVKNKGRSRRQSSYARPGTADKAKADKERIDNLLRPKVAKRKVSDATLDEKCAALAKRIKELKSAIINGAETTPEARTMMKGITGELSSNVSQHNARIQSLESTARKNTKLLRDLLKQVDPDIVVL